MMGTNIATQTFSHYNDCLIYGCPGHEMRVEYQNTSDYYSVYIDDKLWLGGDPNMIGTFISIVNGMRYRVEIDSMLNKALNNKEIK